MTLAEWMAEQNLSDEEVAAKAGTDRSSISRLRRGKQRPSWPLIDRLVEITGGKVTADSFRSGPHSKKDAPAKRRRKVA